ncbi:hypothetical protein A8W25_27510 [Streptomyces sp. ERV7]|uniref:hypothetical protein n=1 Tax=Streptomyces sp. ERV7 TaxID=1322334 RepID=UPI0007F52C1D|nr:hypothetical protein [Streptomyces sp. ERV7]OAR23249.1 hypothetical protein A8W25_27510 [Streptomyces sp. ERV7]
MSGELLRTRVETLIGQIGAARTSGQEIGPELRGRVATRLTTAFHLRGAEARELLTEIDDGVAPAALWAKLYRLQLELDELFEETLSLVEGAALRAARLDEGYCVLADVLLDEIGGRTPVAWDSFTVLGTEEIYARSTRVIRVRFPGRSFWDLPVVAHEYGHFAGPAVTVDGGVRTVHPLEDLLDDARKESPDAHWPWLHELFADTFASYVLGPAYGLACAFDRFDPAVARHGTETHPAPNLRIAAIGTVLDRLNQDHRYDHAINAMRAVWSSGTAEAGTEDEEGLTEPFGSWIDACLTFMSGHLMQARYDGWWTVLELAPRLVDEDREELVGRRSTPDVAYRMCDIVNAGWLARIRSADAGARLRIARQARSLAEFSVSQEVP